MNSLLKNIKESVKVAIIALTITLGVTYAYAAWIEPTAIPPNSNVDAPIHIGALDQIKDGALGVNALAVFGNSAFSGYVQIGSSTAACSSGIEGAQRYVSGSGMEYCDGSSWASLGGSAAAPGTVLGGRLLSECIELGGEAVDIGSATPLCQFSGSSCPAEWIQWSQWSTTVGKTCTRSTSCSTGSHPWSDRGVESCVYRVNAGDGGYISSYTCGGIKSSRDRPCYSKTCSATRTVIGCQ